MLLEDIEYSEKTIKEAIDYLRKPIEETELYLRNRNRETYLKEVKFLKQYQPLSHVLKIDISDINMEKEVCLVT